jgi:D-erythro-7,8-dihydroneopterin triphosphate epimerase
LPLITFRLGMDRIIIDGLRARCIIGVKEEERHKKQEVLFNIILFADLRRAGETDDFEETIDYRAIKYKVLEFAEASSFRLLEALAQGVAAICLKDPCVRAVRVRAEKPGALTFAKSAGVEITRRKDEGLGVSQPPAGFRGGAPIK